MKRSVILHGTDGKPESNWFMWLKAKLEEQGYEVWVPLLPDNHTPNHKTYNDFLLTSGWDFMDNLIVGHSSGAVSVLNLLMDERCPHIKLGVMVGAWARNTTNPLEIARLKLLGLDVRQFKDTFPPDGFDFELIKSKADKLAFLHGDDDPYCPLDQAKWLAEQLDASITVVPKGHHLGAKFSEVPELWSVIEKSL